jgi:hypothetical protein
VIAESTVQGSDKRVDEEIVDKTSNNVNEIKNILRFRKKAGTAKLPPVLVEFKSVEAKAQVLSVAKKLRHEYKTLFKKPDRTAAELEAYKEIRKKRDELNNKLPRNGRENMAYMSLMVSQQNQNTTMGLETV